MFSGMRPKMAWKRKVDKRRSNHLTQEEINVKRYLCFVAEGQYSRAYEALISSGLAMVTSRFQSHCSCCLCLPWRGPKGLTLFRLNSCMPSTWQTGSWSSLKSRSTSWAFLPCSQLLWCCCQAGVWGHHYSQHTWFSPGWCCRNFVVLLATPSSCPEPKVLVLS